MNNMTLDEGEVRRKAPQSQYELPLVWDAQALGRYYDALAEWMINVSWYRDERVNDVVTRLLPSRGRAAIELCCGGGFLLSHIAKRRAWERVTGVDASPEMVKFARRHCEGDTRVRVLCGDWIDPIRIASDYDVIIVKNGLHLLSDLGNRLEELREVSSKDAKLIVVETVSPNLEANHFVRNLFRVVERRGPKANYFTVRLLLRALRSAGWSVEGGWTMLRQTIDVADWLRHKCASGSVQERAEAVLRACNSQVRRSMEFEPEDRGLPVRMLRLQMIVRCSRKGNEDSVRHR